jgi:hypothetical protein
VGVGWCGAEGDEDEVVDLLLLISREERRHALNETMLVVW